MLEQVPMNQAAMRSMRDAELLTIHFLAVKGHRDTEQLLTLRLKIF
jgi:hypothetical protein